MAMLTTHLWIGVLEGALTAALVAALAWKALPGENQSAASPRLAYALAAALLAMAVLPLSSKLPDGYEAAARSSGMTWLLSE
jgi:hypothetical protein